MPATLVKRLEAKLGDVTPAWTRALMEEALNELKRLYAFQYSTFAGDDHGGFYHPKHNNRGKKNATESVGYWCECNGAEYRFANSCTGRVLTKWHPTYSKALGALVKGEKKAWPPPNSVEL